MGDQGALLRVIAPVWGSLSPYVHYDIIAPPELFPYLMAALSLLAHEDSWEVLPDTWDWDFIQILIEDLLSQWVAGDECI